MNRLVIRILAGVFITMLIASGLRMTWWAHFFGRFFADPTWYPVRSTAELVVDIIDHTPLEKIDAQRNFLSAALDRRIDIETMEDSDLSLDIKRQLSEGKMIYGRSADAKAMFYAPVHHGTHLVVIDPSFQSYRPAFQPIDYFLVFIWVSIGAAIIGFFLAYPLSRRLNNLEATVERICRGDTAARTPFVTQDLIGSVEQCFNQMADRIQTMISSQHHLLGAIVRKFQSDVAQISGFMNELIRGKKPSEIKLKAQKIDDVIDDLDQFVRDLLQNEKDMATGGPTGDGKPRGPEAEVRFTQSALRTGIRKFFIRMSIGILIALPYNHLFGPFMSQIAYRNLSFDPDWYPLRTTAALIQRAANTSTMEALPQRLEALQAGLKNRIDFLPAGKASSDAVEVKPSNTITYGFYDGRRVFFAPLHSGAGTLIIPIDIQMYRVRPSLLSHLSAIPFEFVFIIFGSMLLSLPIILDVKKLVAGIERIRQGDLTARVDVPLNRPIGKLAAGFNEMTDRVQSLLTQQRHLVQAVAHEIRTPVSRIRFHLEMLAEAESSIEVDRRIGDIMEEIKELNQLTAELQTLAALDTPDEGFSKTAIPLHDTLAEIVDYLQKPQDRPGVVMMNTGRESAYVSAQPVYFRRAIVNMLSNAIRYAQFSVSIHYRVTDGGIFIDIRDDGPGIPLTARKTVFDPFIRLDGSRNRNTGGFGLGLAIVQRIMSLHGGSVSIGDNIPQGTIMTTFWPHRTPAQVVPPVTN